MHLPINDKNPEKRKIGQAVEILRDGGVIAYPTGTVYGLGCDLTNKKALERVYQIKGIDRKKPLSFLCPDLSEIARFAFVDNTTYRILKRLVPGPYTFILEATKEVPRLVLRKRNTVGIRVPDHPVAQALLETLGSPIISTSATKDGQVLMDGEEIEKAFPALDLVLDAGPGSALASTILAFSSTGEVEVIREGAGDLDKIPGRTEQ
ncbi:MAG: threonylcarbamoyl-AMP synthase [Deltaproteobacteria bacterium]|nr:threonylcarbamoyl-AMP synthase [Deltaproteobacteria bacterium]